MRVPDLEAMIAAEEQQALPETRLVNALRGYNHSSIGDERLLELCRDAWGVPERERVVPGTTRNPPADAGWKFYHSTMMILAGLHPGLGSWRISTVLNAVNAYMKSQRAGS